MRKSRFTDSQIMAICRCPQSASFAIGLPDQQVKLDIIVKYKNIIYQSMLEIETGRPGFLGLPVAGSCNKLP